MACLGVERSEWKEKGGGRHIAMAGGSLFFAGQRLYARRLVTERRKRGEGREQGG
jgi:hypothetical protein